MAEQLPLIRQWILLRTLCSRRHRPTGKELVQLCVSDKTIRRDLETFKKAGFRRAVTVEEFNRKKRHIKADEQILGGEQLTSWIASIKIPIVGLPPSPYPMELSS